MSYCRQNNNNNNKVCYIIARAILSLGKLDGRLGLVTYTKKTSF